MEPNERSRIVLRDANAIMVAKGLNDSFSRHTKESNPSRIYPSTQIGETRRRAACTHVLYLSSVRYCGKTLSGLRRQRSEPTAGGAGLAKKLDWVEFCICFAVCFVLYAVAVHSQQQSSGDNSKQNSNVESNKGNDIGYSCELFDLYHDLFHWNIMWNARMSCWHFVPFQCFNFRGMYNI